MKRLLAIQIGLLSVAFMCLGQGTYVPPTTPYTRGLLNNAYNDAQARYLLRLPMSVKDHPGYAKGDGKTDDTMAIQKMIDTAGGRSVYFPSGKYLIGGQLNIRTNIELRGDGMGATIINFNSATGITNAGFYAEGSLTELPVLGLDLLQGGKVVQFASDSGLRSGDTYLIWNTNQYSYSGYRSYYYQGEYFRVRDASGLFVTNMAPSFNAYSSGGTSNRLYKLNPLNVSFSDMTVLGVTNEAVASIRATLCADTSFRNLELRDSPYAQISLDRCVRVAISDCFTHDRNPTYGVNYGVHIGNSQEVTISGGAYWAGRHGISVGGNDEVGSIPNRSIVVSGCVVGSHGDSFGFDMHGNAERNIVANCVLYGATIGNFSGFVFNDNIVYQFKTNLYALATGGEGLGFDGVISGNYFNCLSDFNGSVVSITVRTNTALTGGSIQFTGNKLHAGLFKNSVYSNPTIGAEFLNLGTNETCSLDISGNTISTDVTNAGPNYGIKITSGIGKPFNTVRIKQNTLRFCGIHVIKNARHIDVSDNTVENALEHGINISSTVLSFTNLINVSDNIVTRSRQAGIAISGSGTAGNIILEGNQSYGNGIDIEFTGTDSGIYVSGVPGTVILENSSCGLDGHRPGMEKRRIHAERQEQAGRNPERSCPWP